jgi:hypothetical protein
MVFEAHSTDCQTEAGLRQLVTDGVCILKVDPWLTFARREALYCLDAITDVLDVDGHPPRHRLMATRVEKDGTTMRLVPEGKPYSGLLGELLSDPRYESLGLRRAAANPPEQGGINIEGLGSTAEGGLLIGFRSPLVEGKALLAPVLNPKEVLDGQKLRLGDPILLDLEGLGVRDMVWSGKEHFLIGGGVKGAAKAKLFRWTGGTAAPEAVKGTGFKHFNPEALTVMGSGPDLELLVLSDDGNRQGSTTAPSFRSFRVKP